MPAAATSSSLLSPLLLSAGCWLTCMATSASPSACCRCGGVYCSSRPGEWAAGMAFWARISSARRVALAWSMKMTCWKVGRGAGGRRRAGLRRHERERPCGRRHLLRACSAAVVLRHGRQAQAVHTGVCSLCGPAADAAQACRQAAVGGVPAGAAGSLAPQSPAHLVPLQVQLHKLLAAVGQQMRQVRQVEHALAVHRQHLEGSKHRQRCSAQRRQSITAGAAACVARGAASKQGGAAASKQCPAQHCRCLEDHWGTPWGIPVPCLSHPQTSSWQPTWMLQMSW